MPTGPVLLNQLVFFIPGMLTQSLNEGIRQHTGQKHQAKQRWRRPVEDALRGLVHNESATYFWHITITRRSTRKLDYTNLVGSMKPLEDVIRDTGLIRDDDPDSIEIAAKQEIVAKAAVGMLIELRRGHLLT